MTKLDSILKSRHYFASKGPSSQSYVFSLWMGELDYKESWAPKNWCFWTMVLEEILENPLDCKVKPVNPKETQSWTFIGRNDAEAEVPILWCKSQLIGKAPDAGKERRLEEKGTTEDKMVGQHHTLNGHEFEQVPGDGDGQGSLACSSPWVAESWTWLIGWTTKFWFLRFVRVNFFLMFSCMCTQEQITLGKIISEVKVSGHASGEIDP